MESKKKESRIGSVLSLPNAGLILLFFFLPWLKISCQGADLAQASGLQLTTGKISLTSEFEQLGSQSGEVKSKSSQDPEARPWFALGAALPILVALVAGLGLGGRLGRKSGGKALVVLGVLGVLLMICAAQVDYLKEMDEPGSTSSTTTGPPGGPEAAIEGASAMMKDVKPETKTTEILWLTLVLYGLVATGGFVEIYGKR